MEIKLTGNKGGVAIVSEIDYDLISEYKWRQNKNGYARGNVDGISISMHLFIMKQIISSISKNKIVDHINRNRLDNRRENLRLVDYIINGQNRGISKRKESSKYKCVYYDKNCKKYVAKTDIGSNEKSIWLGLYENEIDAAEAFDMYLVHNNYDHVQLNFPDKYEEYLKREYVPYKKNKLSNYVGVTKRSKNTYRAQIRIDGELIYIKNSSEQIECANAYDKYIVDNNVPGKKLNFPENYPMYDPNSVIKTQCEKTNNKNIVRLILNSVPEEEVLIDKEDYDNVKYYAWCLSDGYVATKQNIRLHHFVMKITDKHVLIDHIDSNPLNNCKNNLRISDTYKNSRNRSKKVNALSKYLGVGFDKRREKWTSKIEYNYEKISLGYYITEIYAARAHDLYILIHLKNEHYKLNFEWTDKDIEKWKKKIIPLSRNQDKWIPKSYPEQIRAESIRILEALDNNKLLLCEKLNLYQKKKIKESIEADLKIMEENNM